MDIFKNSKNILIKKTRGAIIPHAGKYYSGDIRYNSFKYFKNNYKYIIYIAALHKMYLSKKNVYYVLNKDNGFPDFFDNKKINLEYNLDESSINEHSFKWVEEELRNYFKDSKILVLAPSRESNLDILSNLIVEFLNYEKNSILFSTTDLIHFGENYNTEKLLKYPQQLDKIKKESELIISLKYSKSNLVEEILYKNSYLACGPKAITLFIKVVEKMGWLGKVTDYYDSYGLTRDQKLDRYIIDYKNVNNFVSYISIIYGNYNKNELNRLTEFDLFQGIGLSKSIIIRDTMFITKFNLKYDLFLPKWSLFNKEKKNGIFVGTEILINNILRTNCSYGRFQDNITSISNKIIAASGDCYKDALK